MFHGSDDDKCILGKKRIEIEMQLNSMYRRQVKTHTVKHVTAISLKQFW